MSDELLNQALSELLETIRATKDFTLEQAPDVIQQLITYNMVWSGTISVFMLIILTAVGRVTHGFIRKNGFDELIGISLFVSAGIPLPIMLVNMQTFIKCWLAPKVFIIEYISKLVS